MSGDEESNYLVQQGQTHSKSNRLWIVLIWIWRFCIFGITGSTSMVVTRFIIQRIFGMASSGWEYFAVFFFLELVVYTIMLVIIGSCLGQWRFFCAVAFKMWGWLLPAQFRQTAYTRLQSDYEDH
ncbi:hypothetical protein BJV82DRAFT_669551 [Fennellomyces sp. T-0311]|nr:hypothetical protein BJV82DRAFT_669551 [Fennellomyces sp. T-0311]